MRSHIGAKELPYQKVALAMKKSLWLAKKKAKTLNAEKLWILFGMFAANAVKIM